MQILLALLAAQDFGVQWADRVTHQMQQDRGPLQQRPTVTKLAVGALYVYDSNIFLEEDHEDSNSIIIPFLGVQVEHSTQRVEVRFDGLANWKEYVQDEDESGDEERVYGMVRYVSGGFEASIAEFYRHESDPIDVLFADRVERIVSDTVPRLSVDFLPMSVELGADLGVVRMMDEDFEKVDNTNLRADLSLIYKAPTGYELVVQGGLIMIDYRYETGAPSDSDGLYVRGGFRGDLTPAFHAELLAGFTSVEADEETVVGAGPEEDSGADVSLHLRWEATPQTTMFADFSRLITFSTGQGGGDPFQTVNRFVWLLEWQALDRLTVKARFQYDTIETPSGNNERDYLSAGPWFQWKYMDQMLIEVGGAIRTGEVDGGPEYDDVIFQAGVVFTN